MNLLQDVTEPLIEFIFVHGLGGGSRKTWSKTSKEHHYWPKEWLPRDTEFSCVRIWSFGYKADWDERKDTVLDVQDFALALLGDIGNAPSIRKSKVCRASEWFFLAYLKYCRRRLYSSLTAWEALSSKKYVMHEFQPHLLTSPKTYILAREDPALKDLASRIHTLYFLATPHRGSDLAKTLTNVLKVSYGQKAFVTGLVRNSSLIHSINISFRHYAEDIQLWSFYETFPSNLVLTSALIVDESSGTLGYAKEHISPLNADHRGICKFDLPSDPNYKTLRNAFITTIDGIMSQST